MKCPRAFAQIQHALRLRHPLSKNAPFHDRTHQCASKLLKLEHRGSAASATRLNELVTVLLRCHKDGHGRVTLCPPFNSALTYSMVGYRPSFEVRAPKALAWCG